MFITIIIKFNLKNTHLNFVIFAFENQWPVRNIVGGYHIERDFIHYNKLDTIASDEEMRGKWTDILVHAKWSDKDDGFFKVWVN